VRKPPGNSGNGCRWAVAVARLGDWLQDGMDYTDLNGTDAEVQVFTDYTRRVSAARTARPDSP
jgi:hypothetical protein